MLFFPGRQTVFKDQTCWWSYRWWGAPTYDFVKVVIDALIPNNIQRWHMQNPNCGCHFFIWELYTWGEQCESAFQLLSLTALRLGQDFDFLWTSASTRVKEIITPTGKVWIMTVKQDNVPADKHTHLASFSLSSVTFLFIEGRELLHFLQGFCISISSPIILQSFDSLGLESQRYYTCPVGVIVCEKDREGNIAMS